MKKITVTVLVLLTITVTTKAQEISKGFAAGFQIGQYQKDFGLGLNLTSPYFLYQKVAVRVRGNFMWNEHLDANNETTWTSYSNLSFGLVGVAGEIGDFARLYGEGGIVLLFPDAEFSSVSSDLGGYGIFGFEFYANKFTGYFLEVGGVGVGAVADKVPNKPIYSNGLIINTGFRFNF